MTDNSKQLRDTMTSVIYEELFGKSRIELITESKPKWYPESHTLHNGDVDEIMRDCMTIDAIQVLSVTEAALAMFLRRYPDIGNSDFLDIAREMARLIRVKKGDFKVWEWQE